MAKRPSIDCNSCDSKELGVFCDLNQNELSEISMHKVTNHYKKGQTLFFQGNPAFGLYCISTGKIKVTKVAPDGKESIVRLAKDGDILGHRSLFTEEFYQATATALEDCTICFLDKKFILKAITDKPAISFNIIQKLSQDMGAAETKVASMYQKNVRERLAELLLMLKETFGERDENNSWKLEIKLTREEMASMIGVANETLIRFLSEFREDGFIQQKGKTIYIVDEESLINYSNAAY